MDVVTCLKCPARRTQVNYVGKAANLYVDAGYQLAGSAYVINKHLGTTWLWDRVRVSGGAYGGFCDFDTHSGMFSFLSYRDPNLTKTVRAPHAHAPDVQGFHGLGFDYIAMAQMRPISVGLPSATSLRAPLPIRQVAVGTRAARTCTVKHPQLVSVPANGSTAFHFQQTQGCHATTDAPEPKLRVWFCVGVLSVCVPERAVVLAPLQVDVYDGTADFLRSLELDQGSLTRAIIGTIGDMDSYQLPDAKGYTAFLRHLLGVSDEERQARREQILGTSVQDFRRVPLP